MRRQMQIRTLFRTRLSNLPSKYHMALGRTSPRPTSPSSCILRWFRSILRRRCTYTYTRITNPPAKGRVQAKGARPTRGTRFGRKYTNWLCRQSLQNPAGVVVHVLQVHGVFVRGWVFRARVIEERAIHMWLQGAEDSPRCADHFAETLDTRGRDLLRL